LERAPEALRPNLPDARKVLRSLSESRATDRDPGPGCRVALVIP
jgi:hypothetical protein